MLMPGDKIGITACSDALHPSSENKVSELLDVLSGAGLCPVLSPYIYAVESIFSGTARQRASALMNFYLDDSIKAIFDISGGDLSNSMLDYLDFDRIKTHPKPFWGYSDLSVVINAIYTKAGNPSYLYRIRNLIGKHGKIQQERFFDSILHNGSSLYDVSWEFIQGSQMEGILVGGNLRCFLKLAGTPYFPDLNGRILFLEGYHGGVAHMTTHLSQLRQMGAFRSVSGILLGTFTEMEEKNETPEITELLLRTIENDHLPIARTREVGHGSDSKCLIIGKEYSVKNVR